MPTENPLEEVVQKLQADLDATKGELQALRAEYEAEQHGAILWITAVVGRAVAHGTNMTFSKEDMEEAMNLELERADNDRGGVTLRVVKYEPPPDPDFHPIQEPPKQLITELSPVLAKPKKTIVLLDPSGRPNQ